MNTTTRNATLQDLAAMLQNQQTRKLDVVASATKITAEGGLIRVTGAEPVLSEDGVDEGDGLYRPTAIFDEGMSSKLGIPTAYLRRMRENRPDLYDANVNGWLHGGGMYPADPRTFLVRAFRANGDEGIARAFLSDRFGIIDHLDALMAVLEAIHEAGVNVVVDKADLTDRRMTVKVTAPEITAVAETLLQGYRNPFGEGSELDRWREVADREGLGYGGKEPIVFAGFVISNSETGGGAFTLTPRMTLQVCANGLVITKDALRAVHLGGKLDEGAINWSEETQRRALALVKSKTVDAVHTFLNPDYLADALGRVEAKAGEPVDTIDTVRDVTKGLSFTEEQINGVLGMFVRGGQMTLGGVANAITAYAQTVADGDTAFDMEAAASELLTA